MPAYLPDFSAVRRLALAASVSIATLCLTPTAVWANEASETSTRTVKTLPVSSARPSIQNIYRVSGDKTPSGFDVPRYVSLKFGRVNARTGPSRNHPVAYQYQRRGLPLIIVAETEMWRKVRDIQGDEAWVRKPALSGERFAILTSDSQIFSKPTSSARTVARVENGALVHLEDCPTADFCQVRTRTGVKGFAPRQSLWGAQALK